MSAFRFGFGRNPLPAPHVICFNGRMDSFRNLVTGRVDLEPFWPSRQHHDFDRVCQPPRNARAL
ncbi:hypothetical protein [Streptomyces sp. NPDC047046]|uniref:hypothetical protein n=1 Tax=Streptomyces sp. NPDC047046 TaxID=3155378 RepID=UPI0033DB52AF